MDFLVIGLGNPGKEYEHTRHNVGYDVIDILCARNGATLSKETPSSLGATVRIGNSKGILARSTTYMNDSGKAVGEIARRYKLEPDQIIVIHDELDLTFADVKLKIGGGLAGHNGLRSIKSHLSSDGFIRVRIGVGKPSNKEAGASHVLSSMSRREQEDVEISCEKAADAVEMIISDSLDAAMRVYHTA